MEWLLEVPSATLPLVTQPVVKTSQRDYCKINPFFRLLALRASCYNYPMTSLTINVDPEVLKRARIKALENDESVNQYLARKLEEYANTDTQESHWKEFLNLARASTADSGPEGRTWTREDLYRERLERFLDTNILVYSFDSHEPEKRERALAALEQLPHRVLSTQVLLERGPQ